MHWSLAMTVSDTPSRHRTETSQSGDDPSPTSPIRNGGIGGFIAVIISFIPLSTLLGGGIAGYLTDGIPDQQLRAGATAGGIAAIPSILIGWYIDTSPAIILPGRLLGLGRGTVIAGAFVMTVVSSIALSILGSLAGGSLARSNDG